MIRLVIEVTESKLDDLVREAIVLGWMRNDPTKRFTTIEKKSAARYAIRRFIHEDRPI